MLLPPGRSRHKVIESAVSKGLAMAGRPCPIEEYSELISRPIAAKQKSALAG